MVKGVLTVGTLLRLLSLLWIICNCVGWQRLCEERKTLCTVGLCATPTCDECNNKRSICHPTDPSEPIPQTLPNNTLHILIYYKGPPVELDMNMFKMFYRLVNLTLYGNFRSLSPHTFSQNKFLTEDRKSTRLNSSHQIISYAVFCLKKKKTIKHINTK